MVMTIYLLAEMLKNCANGQYHSITIRAKNVCCEIYLLSIMLSKYMPHIGRLLTNRIFWASKLTTVTDSLVHGFHVVPHWWFSVRFKRALVTGDDAFFVNGLFVNLHTPFILKDLVTIITLIIMIVRMFEPFVFNHISFPGEFFAAYVTYFFCAFWVNDNHVSLQFIFTWQHPTTVGADIIMDTSMLESNMPP